MKKIALIPAYEPDEKLINLYFEFICIQKFRNKNGNPILINILDMILKSLPQLL